MHYDICGPIAPETNGEKRYILDFIDDYSSQCWSYLLHEKLEAFDHFKRFKAMIENETCLPLKCLIEEVNSTLRSSTSFA